MPEEIKIKPKFFDTVGWSFFIMGALGVFFGLIGFGAVPSEGQVQLIVNQASSGSLAIPPDFFARALKYYMIFNWVQFIFAIVMTWGAWLFLKGKDAGRLLLAVSNWLICVGIGVGFWFLVRAMRSLMGVFSAADLAESGLNPNVPSLFIWAMVVCGILLIAPMVLMGWYFHSNSVRNYFKS